MFKTILSGAALVAVSQPTIALAKSIPGQAVVLDFRSAPTASGSARLPVHRDDALANATRAGFAGNQQPALSAQAPMQSASPGDPSRFTIAVPMWMRSGLVPPTGNDLGWTPPSIGNCGATRGYRPSGLMHARAEQRRRLFYPLIVQAACQYGIPIGLLDAMIIQESKYNPLIYSPKGAFGLGQLMPGTAMMLGVNRFDLRSNVSGAAKYLAAHLLEFHDPSLALAAYNAGPGRVRKVWRIPRIAETQDYVRSILWNWRSLEWLGGGGI